MADEALPLAGYRVVEIGHSVAAPYAALILAELGAEVIKVERPGRGDDARAWGPPFIDEMSAVFHALNRLKRSVVLDLKSPQGVAKLKQLARVSDVVIQNQRPGLAWPHWGQGPLRSPRVGRGARWRYHKDDPPAPRRAAPSRA